MSIDEEKVKAVQERLKEKLKSTSEPRRKNKMDVIRASFDQIEKLKKKGFRAEEIAADISEVGGFNLSAQTLKNYMQRVKKERGAVRGKPRKQEKSLNKTAALKSVSDAQHTGTFPIKEDRDNL